MKRNKKPKISGALTRRDFLSRAALCTAGGMVAAGISGCGLFDDPEMRVGTVAELETQGFLNPKFNGGRIFATYLDGELVIFSLICRHKKCTVKWESRDEQFQCPCHEGVYDRTGRVVDGPPPGPLHRFKHEIRGGEIWVLNEWV